MPFHYQPLEKNPHYVEAQKYKLLSILFYRISTKQFSNPLHLNTSASQTVTPKITLTPIFSV